MRFAKRALFRKLSTSHSPDLLDDSNIPDELILPSKADGATVIGPVDEAGRSVLRDKLFTPGELLRQNQLAPTPDSFNEVEERQLKLFEIGK